MSDDTAKVRAELQILDGRIQAERNDEVRHGLQRGRLEAERAQLLVKLMDAMVQPAVPLQPTYRVVMQSIERPPPFTVVSLEKPSSANGTVLPTGVTVPSTQPEHHKPSGIPTIPSMILQILQSTDDALKPAEIVNQIRSKWWPNMRPDRVYQSLFRLTHSGRLQRIGDRYRLAAPNGAANAETPAYPAHT